MKTVKNRRRQNKTDYSKRLKLLKSEKPRVTFRQTNKYVIAQYVVSDEAKDKVIFGLDSRELLKYGWPESAKGSLKSVSACYLTGYLIGKQIIKKKLAQPITDFGMIVMIHKGRPYGFIKGLIDAGMEISCKEDAFPEQDRIEGKNLKNKINLQEIKSKIDKI